VVTLAELEMELEMELVDVVLIAEVTELDGVLEVVVDVVAGFWIRRYAPTAAIMITTMTIEAKITLDIATPSLRICFKC
jgi:hypothetical protein